MDPIPITVVSEVIVASKNGFLARAAFQAMGLHSREVNSQGALITPRRSPTVVGRISVLEGVISCVVSRTRPIRSAPGVGWENSR